MLFVVFKSLLLVSVLSLVCFGTQFFVAAQLPQSEVDALNQIAKTMGAIDWIFNGNACGFTKKPASETDSETNITCTNVNNTPHIMTIEFKRWSLSGVLPPELVQLPHLQEMRLSSNRLSGNLPIELAELKNLTQLRIGDISGTNQAFPELENLTALTRMILRNCSISGEVPQYIWEKKVLRILDLSFNNLTGELPDVPISDSLKFIFLSGNSLSGKIRESILKKGIDVDLSYNNFTWPSSEQPACLEAPNLNLNLFRSSMKSYLNGVLPCKENFKCDRYRHSFHINCGGQNVKVNGITFEGDEGNDGGAATYYLNDDAGWGFSSTGDFLDDNDEQNRHFKPEKKNIASIVFGVVLGLCTIVLVLGFLYWRYYVRGKSGKQAAGFSTSDQDLYEISEESYLRSQIENKNSVSELQLSTSMPSWAGSSSTSGRDLYGINSSSK
ncbi:hypothetical protein Dsin_020772 [Dipteronia sinensis]|uniref:Uncharacterized protein n=1 Tax=Dipteronia sinensis TaxID=43782 RepID=A0AAE0E4A2_9ROSI|nr:hypothetical protein Dsin_020772 [Dipteronia sinensis]